MSEAIAMSQLKRGEWGNVIAFTEHGAISRRLQNLGLIPGTRVECVCRSPLGDPAAYRIRGAVIALRDSDARQILVQRREEIKCE